MKVLILFVALIIAGIPALGLERQQCGQFPAAGFDGPDMLAFVGEYSNPNYMFAVTIPQGLVGHDTLPPNPQHGFGVVLSWEPRGYFWFDSSANAALWANAREALADHLRWVRADSQKVVAVRERRAWLGTHPAREQILRYTCHNSAVERVQVVIVSLRGGLVDTAGLLTTSGRFKADYQVFMFAVGTWHTTGKY